VCVETLVARKEKGDDIIMTSYYGAFSVRRRLSWARWKIQRANAVDSCCCSTIFIRLISLCFFLNLNFPPVEISTRSLVITLDGISRLCRGFMLDNIADVMISFQPLLINQPKARKIKRKRKKNEKNFLG
jgi:hypothetical protein